MPKLIKKFISLILVGTLLVINTFTYVEARDIKLSIIYMLDAIEDMGYSKRESVYKSEHELFITSEETKDNNVVDKSIEENKERQINEKSGNEEPVDNKDEPTAKESSDIINKKIKTVEGNTTNKKNEPAYAVIEQKKDLNKVIGFGDNLYTGGNTLSIFWISALVLNIMNVLFKKNNNLSSAELSQAKEYKLYENFNIKKIPEMMLYKLNFNSFYYINNEVDILQIVRDELGGIMLKYNESSIDLGIDEDIGINDIHTSSDTSIYVIRDSSDYYLFVDRMHYNDVKYYRLYQLKNKKIELVEENYGKIEFVGYNYIIGYTDLGMIGYQRCEFKKEFRNGKFELDGEYKVVGDDNSYPGYHICKFYTLVRDLEYNEYDDKTGSYIKKILKKGTKIRSLVTDAKTYIEIETEDKRKGKVEVDEVKGFDNDFIVNGELFMDYYFQGDQNYSLDLFNAIPLY